MKTGINTAIAALLATVLVGALAGAATAEDAAVDKPAAQEAAFFGILLINTTQAGLSEEEHARLARLEQALVEGLEASGRYRMIDTAPVADKAKLYSNMSSCNGCDTDLAAELGADVAVTGEVQKTSNLILGMSIYIREAGTGALLAGGSADMRGNNDESWMRTLRWILKNRILKE